MGACQSRQAVAMGHVVNRKGDYEYLNAPIRKEAGGQESSDVTHATSHESLDRCADQTNSALTCIPSSIIKENTVCIGSAANRQESLGPEDLSNDVAGSNHTRAKTSDMLREYLRGEGASENRTMVHIENTFDVSIEDVYYGVHDGAVLGEGITGKVRLITRKDTGIQRALKRLDLSNLKNKHDLDVLLDEVKIMCALDHPNIVCLEEVYEGDSELYLTQELCTGGDLFDRLEKQTNDSYTEEKCAKLVRQIISSVSYLHSKNIIHRDLKLENFLFQDESSNLKLIDFGLSKHFNIGELQHETVGTPYTVAPEVLACKAGYDEKVDVWAIGVLTYLLLSGDTPFGGACGEDLVEVRNRILSGHVTFDESIWESVSDLAINFIKSILVLDPHKRPSVEELLKHPWLVMMKRNSSLSDDEVPLDSKVVSGLVSFKEMSSTTKFLCEVLSFTLQPGQITGLREEFEKMDSAGKGEINLAGFKAALIARSDEFPLTDIEIEDIFNGLHVRKKDMTIRWHEFIAACLSQCQIDERNIRLAFDRLDSKHKGYVTINDLKNIMDFYGTDRRDLQQIWINQVLDYKSKKDYMTYDDFYNLLKLDRQLCGSSQNVSKSMPGQVTRRNSALNLKRLETPVVSNMNIYRSLHSAILDASKYAGHDNGANSRRSSRKRTSLVLRRSAPAAQFGLACKSINSTLCVESSLT